MKEEMPSVIGKIVLMTLCFLLLSFYAAAARAEADFVRFPVLPGGYSSIKVFDRHGSFAGRLLAEKRYWTPIGRIPAFLQKAVVAVEDSRFYEHSGIDVRGIARALVKDVVKRRLAEGGSTITQQLVKNRYLSGEKSIDRKIQEARLAMDLEKKYSKQQILEMYFNEIYYGNGAWGIAQASRLYFDKNPEELTEAECSLLAGIPKNPGKYNPFGKAASVTGRRDVVLKRMVDLNIISSRQQKALRANPPKVMRQGQTSWYLAVIRNQLTEKYGQSVIETGGLEITAAMDLKLQAAAEKTLSEGVKKISPELQGALLCVDAATGDILAVSGGTDFSRAPYNRAFLAKRQPGSAMKPLIYSAALEKGFNAASIMNDSPVSYLRGDGQAWKPQNYGGEQFGELPLRKALAFSNNLIAIKLLEAIGVPYFTEFAAPLGIRPDLAKGLSLALGTEEVTLKELVAAYSPFANGGTRAEPRSIIRIYDRNRRSWSENPPLLTPVLSPANAYVTSSMLKDVMLYGTARGLARFAKERPSAGKTGTTDDYRDAWFIGYTPQLITGVWVGYDRPRPGGKGFTGGVVAAPIWERFMRTATSGKPAPDFPRPENVVSVAVDPSTGLLATSQCPERKEELFIAGTEPAEYCPKHPAPGGEPAPVPPFQPQPQPLPPLQEE